MLGTASLAKDLKPVTMGFSIDSIVQQIPYHVAKEYGYFEDEGLDVSFEFLAGSSALVQQIIAGNVDTGSPAWGAVFNGIVQGHDLDVYLSWQYKSDFTLATPADSGIKTVADLDGKAVGVSELSGGEVPIVRAVLREAGLTEGEDVPDPCWRRIGAHGQCAADRANPRLFLQHVRRRCHSRRRNPLEHHHAEVGGELPRQQLGRSRGSA
jgi:ABC-type nitrate/sulfonate/bicarbonate transport system substrate-binding protein